MFLSQIKLLGNAMAREERQKLAVNGCYASHQLLWKLFAGEQKRGFLYCTVNDALDQFMVLSAQEPKNYNEIFAIQTKRFNPVLYQGQKLSYQITLNPTVCKNNRRPRCGDEHTAKFIAKRAYKVGGRSSSEQKISA